MVRCKTHRVAAPRPRSCPLAVGVATFVLAIALPANGHVIGEDEPVYDPYARPPDTLLWGLASPEARAPEAAVPAPQAGAESEDEVSTPASFMGQAATTAANRVMSAAATVMARIFLPFAPLVQVHADEEFLFVESDGMPDHPMMVGITAWQQQVPIPQPYAGDNAWRIPLQPIPSDAPLSAKEHFFRGAIALAANGVPIFNPIKNDGVTDTFIAGELDEFGGHSGRGDDYHYHISPLHLQEKLGTELPVAYALDGYPVFGLTEPDGGSAAALDSFNGHSTPPLGYHYHSTPDYPYLNGGFHGHVVEIGGQVDPQPRTAPVRLATRPLRGATITGYTAPGKNQYSLTYTIGDETRYVNVEIGDSEIQYESSMVTATSRTRVTLAAGHARRVAVISPVTEQPGGMGMGMGGGMGGPPGMAAGNAGQ